MSYLHSGDRELHYSDWSHRHLGGDGKTASNQHWARMMAEHMAEHRSFDLERREPSIPQGWGTRHEDFGP